MRKWLLMFFLCVNMAIVWAQNKPSLPIVYPTQLTVAQSGKADYSSIQAAINAVRDLSQVQVTIYIKNGIYSEKVVIPSWKTNITLIGESEDSTILTNSDYSGKPLAVKDANGKDKHSTFTSYTLLVQGNDTRIAHLTIQNKAGRVGQAVALHIEADRCEILHCKLLGNQDTLYTATENKRNYFADCYIEGTTDFIFGEAIAVFERCTIKSLSNSYITAASTRKGQTYGFVFLDCSLVADTGVTKVYLGRPWRPNAKTVWIRTQMGSHILPEGWDNWRNPDNESTVVYAEYNSRGQGANPHARVKWSKQLTTHQAKRYTLADIFEHENEWMPKGKL